MRNATIATSRTRATSDHLIDYRPLPAAWGDVEALHELRAAKALAAERGLDPSTLEIVAGDGGLRRSRRPLALLRRERGTHARTHRSHRGHQGHQGHQGQAAGSLATA